MNKKLVVLAALIFGAAGLFLANTVKAQDAMGNSAMTNSDTAAAPMAGNAAAPAAPAAPSGY